MKELKENYLIYKLKLKDFKEKVDEETNEIKYSYSFDEDVKDKAEKINVNAIKDKIENKENLSDEEIKNLVDDRIREIRNKILEDIKRDAKIVVRDTELIRIVKALKLHEDDDYKFIKEGKYTFTEDLISIGISIPMYKKLKDLDGKIEFNGEIYKRILASSGNVRNKKVIFIKMDLYDKAMEILLVGIDKDAEHKQLSKYNAYIGLANSDTIPVSSPRIVVIEDFENTIEETFDIVTKDEDGNFNVKNDVKKQFTFMPFDGAGLVDVNQARKWTRELGILKKLDDGREVLDYLPSSFQFRQSIGLKGNLYIMDIKEYVKKLPKEKQKIVDAWGNEHNIINENGELLIDAILTKSQFKFKNYYESFENYEEKFNKELYRYKRTFNIAKWGNKKNEDEAMLSYQPLQTLELDIDDIKELCSPTIERIKKISTDADEFIKFRGLEKSNGDRIPQYYKALKENPILFNDSYIREKVNKDIAKMKDNALKGGIIVNGNYQTLTPDLVAFMEYATGQEVKGVVKAHEVYCKYWKEKEVKQIDIIRFPHIAMEHCLADVIEQEQEEFKYINDGVIMSIWDSYLEKLGNADEDGDRILSTNNKLLCKRVENQKTNTILFENNFKLIPEDNGEDEEIPKISNVDKLIEVDCNGMRASIGEVVNKISTLWSMKKSEERDNYIKIMMVVGCLVIDFIKTGVLETVPEEILEFLKNDDKKNDKKKILKPKFLKVKYKKVEKNQNRKNKNIALVGDEDTIESFNNNDCTMNRLHDYMDEELEKIKKLKAVDKDCLLESMRNKDINIYNETYPKILEKIKEFKEELDSITQKNSIDTEMFEYNSDKKIQQIDKYNYLYSYYRNEILSIIADNKQVNMDKLIDYIIYIFYLEEDFALKNESKDMLWNMFGSELRKRAKGIELNNDIDNEIISERREKLLKKKEKIKNNSKKIVIEDINFRNDDDPVVVEVCKDKIFNNINKFEITENSKRVLKALVLLKLIYNHFKMEQLVIYQNKKKKLSRSILAKMTGLNINKIDAALMELKDNEIIDLKISKDKFDILIEITFDYLSIEGGNIVKISSLEKIKTYINNEKII